MKTKGNLSQRHLTFDESSCKMQPPNHSNIDSTNLMHEEVILSIYHEVNNIGPRGGGAGGGVGGGWGCVVCVVFVVDGI